uniref:ATP synthase F0 subunit 6 n=1 Tax=Benedenia seriolae TaxID=160838 RepID=A0A499VWF2_BENSE|nr:ATP synthase F0 subunit 6 [Benedenia seriolae]BBJ70642.1 ATP synthase F0 subunit 6 [Benedenia seriolae]BBJ70713.1 ATP synthase F0 subunit 6 [Benedenia seriolae]BBJ70725.1 ATP synthase F0 subunit 6 [Benedenia seriolae]
MLNNTGLNFFKLNLVHLVDSLSSLYSIFCLTLCSLFLFLRVPYLYNVLDFVGLVIIIIFPLFLTIFFNRIFSGLNLFFSSLLPPGTPLGIAPCVCLAETISYIVRPAVLNLRPFLNITIGSLAGASIGGMVMGNNLLLLFLILLFFYEVFVALVHWFIVVNILGFSINH